jgi:hypothetical protein
MSSAVANRGGRDMGHPATLVQDEQFLEQVDTCDGPHIQPSPDSLTSSKSGMLKAQVL